MLLSPPPFPVVVRPLHQDNNPQLLSLLNRWVEHVPYTAHFTQRSVDQDIFGPDPSSVRGTKWVLTGQFGAWSGDDLVGFVDVATSYGSMTGHLPVGRPLGYLRFLALPLVFLPEQSSGLGTQPPALSDWIDTVAHHLLVEAERFWHRQGVRRAIAFGLDGGYPTFQAGAGTMPGEWADHFRVLTQSDFHLQDRFYCMHRPIGELLEEPMPGLRLSLVQRGSDRDRWYAVYQRAEPVAEARLLYQNVDVPAGINPVGVLTAFHVKQAWRGKGVGKWLLRRLVNDATLQGYRRLVYHLHPDDQAAINLFTQTGFQELDFRGYVFEKELEDRGLGIGT